MMENLLDEETVRTIKAAEQLGAKVNVYPDCTTIVFRGKFSKLLEKMKEEYGKD